MNQYKTTPEYSVEESVKIPPMESKLDNLGRRLNYQEVVAELALLSQELTISVDILGKIRDSVRVLELSLEVHY